MRSPSTTTATASPSCRRASLPNPPAWKLLCRLPLSLCASYAIYKKIQDLFANTEGGFSFNGQYTGSDFADFLLGYAQNYSEAGVKDAGNWDNKSWALYVQDNWKVSPRLTLNLVLRWDGIPHTYEENNRQSNFFPSLYNPADAAGIPPSGNITPTGPARGTRTN